MAKGAYGAAFPPLLERQTFAVATQANHPKAEHRIVTLDLRGLGLWPQWVAVRGDSFKPGDYVAGLQIQMIDHFSLAVQGGRRSREPGVLFIEDGDLVEVMLRRTADITPTPTSSEADFSSYDGGDDSDDIPGSDDTQDQQPRGPGPYGPPPPRPVNERSRSPRRGDGEASELTRVWDGQWLTLDPSAFQLKRATVQAISATAHWLDVLTAPVGNTQPRLSIYTDGSYHPEKNISGFAVVLLLEAEGRTALFGAFGDQILGNSHALWDTTTPPPLTAEQAGIAGAMLWMVQAIQFVPIEAAVIHYDCQVAGQGATGRWKTGAPDKLRQLERYVNALLPGGLRLEYTRAHVGDAWNELADTLAKQAARGSSRVPRLLLAHGSLMASG